MTGLRHSRPKLGAVVAGMALAALATGCADDGSMTASGDGTAATAAPSGPTTTEAPTTEAPTTDGPDTTFAVPDGIALDDTTTPTTGPATTEPPPVLPAVITVTGNGIGELALGSPQVDVLAMLVPLLGEPDMQPAECPGGSDASARFPGALTTHFGAGVLTGWVLLGSPDPDTVPIQTDRGITLGDTVAGLQTAHDEGFQWVEGSTLGIEFYIGSGFPYLGGLTTGQELDATIEALWAGDTCAAR